MCMCAIACLCIDKWGRSQREGEEGGKFVEKEKVEQSEWVWK